jgi:hypothetical protein
MIITSDGLIRTAENARQEFQWAFFSGYRANETLILLLIANTKQFFILAFDNLETPTQWDDLNNLVASKLPPY